MKVAITGCGGFIGSNLAEACLRRGWDVIGIDNLSTGMKEVADPMRFIDLPGRYTFIQKDINETEYLIDIFKSHQTEIIFHLAALPRVQYSTDFPIESNMNNICGTLSVLQAAEKAGARRVVYSASSSMYGGENIPFPTNEDTPAHPRSNYALQKYTGAEYCRLFSELYGLDTVSLIYFNVFGPQQRSNSAYATVIPAFFEAGIKGKSCRVDGDGGQSRDFCHVDNVVQANILAAECKDFLGGEKFNIACGETHSVLEVYKIVKKLLAIDLLKHHESPRLGDPRKSHADISKAQTTLGYKPLVDFDEGMRNTARWWLAGCPTEIKGDKK